MSFKASNLIPQFFKTWAYKRRHRAARRLAANFSPHLLRQCADLREDELNACFQDDSFAELIAAYKEFSALPTNEREQQIQQITFDCLNDALSSGDIRVAIFVYFHELIGRDYVAEIVKRPAKTYAHAPRARKPNQGRQAKSTPKALTVNNGPITKISDLPPEVAKTVRGGRNIIMREARREIEIRLAMKRGYFKTSKPPTYNGSDSFPDCGIANQAECPPSPQCCGGP